VPPLLLRERLKVLKVQVREDDMNLKEFKREIGKLRAKKEHLERKLAAKREVYDQFSASTPEFPDTGIEELYSKTAAAHGRGIKLLQKEFGYNPLYKKHNGSSRTFHGSPFVPLKPPARNNKALPPP